MNKTAAIAFALLAFTACSSDAEESAPDPVTTGNPAAAPTGDPAIDIVDFTFSPDSKAVTAGTTVTWTNQDSALHSVEDTSDLGVAVSDNLAEGDTFTITYDAAGTYSYICGIHNYMSGEIVVQ